MISILSCYGHKLWLNLHVQATAFESNDGLTLWEAAEMMGCFPATSCRHLVTVGPYPIPPFLKGSGLLNISRKLLKYIIIHHRLDCDIS